jgi:hypothetical protein
MVLQDRSLATRSPRSAAMRALAQSAFVDEDDGAAFVFGLFINAGQRARFHCRILASSRSPAFVLDQVGHPPRRPQAGFITQHLWPTLQTALDAPQVSRMQARLAPSSSRLLQRPPSTVLQLPRPTDLRIADAPHTPGHLGLAISLLQQPHRFHPPLLQSLKISANSRRIPHAGTLPQNLGVCQYIIQCSIGGSSSDCGSPLASGLHVSCLRLSRLPPGYTEALL